MEMQKDLRVASQNVTRKRRCSRRVKEQGDDWKILEASMEVIERREEWIDVIWLEKSSIEDQRLKYRRQTKARGMKREMEGKMEKTEKDGIFQQGWKDKEEPKEVWKFWQERADDVGEKQPVKGAEIANQVEEYYRDDSVLCLTQKRRVLEEMTNQENCDSLMFGRDHEDEDEETCEDEERKEKNEKQKQKITRCAGKIRDEMHATQAGRKDADKRKFGLLIHGRSPAGGGGGGQSDEAAEGNAHQIQECKGT